MSRGPEKKEVPEWGARGSDTFGEVWLGPDAGPYPLAKKGSLVGGEGPAGLVPKRVSEEWQTATEVRYALRLFHSVFIRKYVLIGDVHKAAKTSWGKIEPILDKLLAVGALAVAQDDEVGEHVIIGSGGLKPQKVVRRARKVEQPVPAKASSKAKKGAQGKVGGGKQGRDYSRGPNTDGAPKGAK